MQIFESVQSGEATPVVIIEPHGRIDSSTAHELADRLTGLISAGSPKLIIDFREIAYISSAGFRTLLIAGRAAEVVGGQLVLCGVAGEIRRLFDLGAFTDLFMICGSREESLARLR